MAQLKWKKYRSIYSAVTDKFNIFLLPTRAPNLKWLIQVFDKKRNLIELVEPIQEELVDAKKYIQEQLDNGILEIAATRVTPRDL